MVYVTHAVLAAGGHVTTRTDESLNAFISSHSTAQKTSIKYTDINRARLNLSLLENDITPSIEDDTDICITRKFLVLDGDHKSYEDNGSDEEPTMNISDLALTIQQLANK